MIVAIHGLGLMGASLGAALRRKKYRVIGIARRRSVARKAVALGACDHATTDLDAVETADVVVLATPISVILKTLDAVASRMKPEALLTDLGSTKSAIMKVAAETGVPYVGGHPMAGNELSGVEACDANLYCQPPYYHATAYLLIKSKTTRRRDIVTMNALTQAAGARPLWLPSARYHDRAMASISNIPYLVAYALMESALDTRVAGPSFVGATRVAASDVTMISDVLLSNRAAIAPEMRRFLNALKRLGSQLRSPAAFRKTLERLRAARMKL